MKEVDGEYGWERGKEELLNMGGEMREKDEVGGEKGKVVKKV